MTGALELLSTGFAEVLRPDDQAKALIGQKLKLWLRQHAVAGNEDRVRQMEARIDTLVKGMEIAVDDDQHFSVKVSGDSEEALNLLDRGSLWFPPHPDIVREIADAYLQ